MTALDTFLIRLLNTIVNPLINLMFALALVYFLWGVFNFIKGAADPGERSKGAQHIMWGLIGLFIMTGVYGILYILRTTVFLR